MGDSFVPHPSISEPNIRTPVSIPELYDWHYLHSREHPLYVFREDTGTQRTIKMGEGVQGFHRATRLILDSIKSGQGFDSRTQPRVAILASSESIAYISVIIGILRAGCIAFPISPRNSPEALSHLLSKVAVSHILISSEPAVQELLDEAIKRLEGTIKPLKLSMPTFKDILPCDGFDPDFKLVPMSKVDINSIACIYHSSGSTSFPQPIYLTHRALYCFSSLPSKSTSRLSGMIYGCHAVPIFHGMGWMPLTFPAGVGLTIAVFLPTVPPIKPNPSNTLEAIISIDADYLLTAPSFAEVWSENPEDMKKLARMKGLVYSGGPLAKKSGDTLASNGVNVILAYGTTQTALLSRFVPNHPGMDWEYFEFAQGWSIHMKEYGDNLFEVVVMDSDSYKPYIFNTEVNEHPAFASGDLVEAHPKFPGRFRIVGRTDDQIIHSNGEKTNPTPLEHILNQDPHVESSIVFGSGREQCGVLFQPSSEFVFDASDTSKLITFRNAVWPTVQKANKFAPSHSRIFKEMIIAASPEKPFQYTSKHTVRRQFVISEYKQVIDNLYSMVAESTQEDICGPDSWTKISTLEFVNEVVEHTMKHNTAKVSKDDDLFQYGLDSIQATWIRNTILRVLRKKSLDAAKSLSADIVYNKPTVNGISSAVFNAVTGAFYHSEEESTVAKLQEMLERHSKDFPTFSPAADETILNGDTVLLTGSTGSLGSNVLAKLIQNSSIARVYALSRHSPAKSARARLTEAFQKDGLDKSLLSSPKVCILEGDPNEQSFALGTDKYIELLYTVTHVIHAAWRVNFKNSIDSFEPNIQSLRRLVDFSLLVKRSSPARLIFVSSIGIFQNHDTESQAALEKPVESFEGVLKSGYGSSKLIGEWILERASAETPLHYTVLRIGQLTGGPKGAWNEHEWFPSLIKSSVALGRLPNINGNVSWISANLAADVILDSLHSEDNVYHISNPNPTSWSHMINMFAEVLILPVVPYEDWLSALEASAPTLYAGDDDLARLLRKIPALRILDVFQSARGRHGNKYEPLGLPILSTENSSRMSSGLRNASPIALINVEAWVAYWKGAGFIE